MQQTLLQVITKMTLEKAKQIELKRLKKKEK